TASRGAMGRLRGRMGRRRPARRASLPWLRGTARSLRTPCHGLKGSRTGGRAGGASHDPNRHGGPPGQRGDGAFYANAGPAGGEGHVVAAGVTGVGGARKPHAKRNAVGQPLRVGAAARDGGGWHRPGGSAVAGHQALDDLRRGTENERLVIVEAARREMRTG